MEKVKIGGWKTKAGAASLILVGLGGMIQGIVQASNGDIEGGIMAVKLGFTSIAAGLAMVGVGHKAEKIKALLEK